MYELVIDYMNFQASVSVDETNNRVPLAPGNEPSSPTLNVERAPPLCEDEWRSLFNSDGRILNESCLRKAIFKGGIADTIRAEVWMYLFGFYSFISTPREREVIAVEQMVQYEVLKEKWHKELQEALAKDSEELERYLNPPYCSNNNAIVGSGNENDSVEVQQQSTFAKLAKDSEELERHLNPPYCSNNNAIVGSGNENDSVEVQQQSTFAKIVAQINVNKKKINVSNLRHYLRTIDKDVPRTDRNLPFYQNPKNLLALRNILITYVSFSPDIGYTQGMNDLVSRFHVVLKSEYKTYYCFLDFMERVEKEFLEDGMIKKLELIQTLLKKMDLELYDFFKALDIKELLFCHRWLLLNFKREFNYEDSLKIFEIISSHHLELWSLEAEKERRSKRAEEMKNQDGQLYTGLVDVNADFTFDLFVCLAILVSHRTELSMCHDLASIYNTINGLSMNLDLNQMLAKAESLFLSYCRNSVVDCFQVVDIKK